MTQAISKGSDDIEQAAIGDLPAVRFCTCRATPHPVEKSDVIGDGSSAVAGDEPRSITELSPGEVSICSEALDGGKGGELELTNRRIIVRGGVESRVLFSSMRIDQVDSISVLRVPHGRRMLYWGVVGALAAIGVWQSLDGTGNLRIAITGIVALTSMALLIAHLIRPPNVRLVFSSVFGSELTADFAYDGLEKADRFASTVWSQAGPKNGNDADSAEKAN